MGLNGRFGKNTKISNVWIEHANVGAWVGRDYYGHPGVWNPADNLQFTGMRIRDTYADGINFTNGTRNSQVFNSSFRTTGDDSLAVWANPYVKDQAVDIGHDNHFVNNTIQLPWRANGIAIYGGYDNSIENNLIYDTMNYPGIMLATDHSPLPFSGTTLIANNGLFRTVASFWNEDQEFGAITLFPQGKDITGVTIRDTDISTRPTTASSSRRAAATCRTSRSPTSRIDKSNNGAGILAMSGARGNATLIERDHHELGRRQHRATAGDELRDHRRLEAERPFWTAARAGTTCPAARSPFPRAGSAPPASGKPVRVGESRASRR